jgi:hypothetical protein
MLATARRWSIETNGSWTWPGVTERVTAVACWGWGAAREPARARGSQAGSSVNKRAGKIEAISAAGALAGARGAKGGCAPAHPINSFANRGGGLGGAGGRSRGSSSNGGSGLAATAPAAALRGDVERAMAAGAPSLLAVPNEQRRAIRDKAHVARQVGMRLWKSTCSMLIQAMFIAKLRTRQLRRAREAASTVQSHLRGNLARRALGKAIGGGDASSTESGLDAARMAMRDRARATHSPVPLQTRRSAAPQYRLTSGSPTLSPVSSSMNMSVEGMGEDVFVASSLIVPPACLPRRCRRGRRRRSC